MHAHIFHKESTALIRVIFLSLKNPDLSKVQRYVLDTLLKHQRQLETASLLWCDHVTIKNIKYKNQKKVRQTNV